MQPSDRQAFDAILAELFGALDKPLTDAKREGFWMGLQKMSIVEFSRCRALLLGELSDGEPRKYFTVSDVWSAKKRMRARGPAVHSPVEVEWQGTEWMRRVNLLFLGWLMRDASKRKYAMPAPEMLRRREICREIAGVMDEFHANNYSDAACDELKRTFAEAMANAVRAEKAAA